VLRGRARELSDAGALEEEELRERPRGRQRVGWQARLFAGICAGALAAAVLIASHPPTAQLPAPAAAAIGALVVVLLPRLGWIAAAVWAGALYTALVGIEQLARPGVDGRTAAAASVLAAVIAVAAAAYRRSRGEVALGPQSVP